MAQDLAGLHIVIDNKNPDARDVRDQVLALRFARPQPEPRSEMKCAAGAVPALDPDIAAHQFDKSLGNRETQPRPAVLPSGGAVGLAERLKHTGRLFRRHADSRVPYGKLQIHSVRSLFRQGHGHTNLSTFGEFHRIVDKIYQDLTEPQRVTNEIWRQIMLRSDEEF